ncbi:CLUMA_CG004930, isoform A [Clunio marinus]|uniref:CLUMA_CG004930, isoform A n=1 Tax=Clunio marinus TaxID=568069 RepID=A0A1J1HUN4_9DIPT|nr:CLUMA_CG004930, isoform A [Clunio marinus]
MSKTSCDNFEKSNNVEASTSNVNNTSNNSNATPKRKNKNNKTPNNNINNISYEHHLEKWLENTSKMNGDDNSFDNIWPFMNTPSSFQPHLKNRKSAVHPQFQYNDTISLPSFKNSSQDEAQILAGFLNQSSSSRQQQIPNFMYPQQHSQQSSLSNHPLASSFSTQEFHSLPFFDNMKNDKSLNSEPDFFDNARRNESLLIKEKQNGAAMLNESENSPRTNDLSVDGDLDDDEEEKQLDSNNFTEPNDKKLLVNLLKQIKFLHETNSKIFRNLHETKVELEALKHAPSWGLRHRKDSVSGLSVHSQPFGYGGTASPAPTYYSQGGSNYPGVVTDLIREVRDAGRIRDDSLMNRVRAMVDEKSWSLNEVNMRLMREMEEIKIHLQTLKIERETTVDRISRLEEEVHLMKASQLARKNPFQNFSQFHTQLESSLAANDHQNRSNNMNLSYGITNRTNDGFLFDEKSQSPSKDDNSNGSHVMQLEKDTVLLRRDLQDALASRKQAENRILALEHLVTSLKSSTQLTDTGHQHNNLDKSEMNETTTKTRITDKKQNFPSSHDNQMESVKTAKASQVKLPTPSGPITDL